MLFHARDRLLKPGGRMVPDAAIMEAVLVSAPVAHTTYVASWSNEQHGVDLAPGRTYAANTIYHGPTILRDASYIAEPVTLLAVDLTKASYDALHVEVGFAVTEDAECHGLAGWFRVKLGDTWLSTSPKSPPTHWSPVYLPIDPPLTLEQNDRVSLALDRRSGGDWTWRLKSPRGSRRHSTLLGVPIVPGTLEKAAQTYVPPVTDALARSRRSALADVARCVGTRAHSKISRYPSVQASFRAGGRGSDLGMNIHSATLLPPTSCCSLTMVKRCW